MAKVATSIAHAAHLLRPAPACAVILAAGTGARLGGVAKALLPFGGRTVLETVWATAQQAGVAHGVVVVAEPFAEAVSVHARELGLAVVRNAHPAAGMVASIEAAFTAHAALAQPQALGPTLALLWPVDHAEVRAPTVAALLRTCGGAVAMAPSVWHEGRWRGGHPVVVARRGWPTLQRASHYGTLRAALATLGLVRLLCDDVAMLHDIDTPQAYAAALARLQLGRADTQAAGRAR